GSGRAGRGGRGRRAAWPRQGSGLERAEYSAGGSRLAGQGRRIAALPMVPRHMLAPAAQLDRQEIALRIPHAGAMCLLERVVAWDRGEIRCEALSHRDPANPLRRHGRLPVSAGIEYAAQAMAVHGALLEPPAGAPRRGFLAVLSQVTWQVPRLDDQPGPLQVAAFRQTVIAGGTSYDFEVGAGGV